MKRLAIIAMAILLGFGLMVTGCQTGKSQTAQKDMTADDLVAEAKKNVCEVSVSEARGILDKGDCIFLDCREPKEFKMGHVPGAMNIPRGLMEFTVDKKIPDKKSSIVVYCKVGGRGCLSACTLCRMGYKNVKNMAGGWLAWEKAGYPVE